MPGQTSLRAQRYYAHPRNGFWPILQFLMDGSEPAHQSLDAARYQQCCAQAMHHGIAIWDILACCERPGSLDSAIVRGSEVVNDLEALAHRHPELELLICNGKTAERLLQRHFPDLSSALHGIRRVTVPSSSPAMASLSLPQKAIAWKAAIRAGTS